VTDVDTTTTTFALRLIPLMPLLGAAYLMLFGRKISREWVSIIASGAIGASAIVSFDAYFAHLPSVGDGALTDVLWTWMQAGDLKIDLAFRLDALSGLLCLIVTFIGFLIHVYSQGYMEHDPDYPRFFAYLNLFCGAMLVLVLGDSLPVMFVGWEGVGLCSYLLIGFWYKETANADAGKKAFIVNRIGDFGFLIGMFLLYQYAGTLTFTGINEAARGSSLGSGLLQPLWLGAPVAFWIGLFLFIGATGKSAQIPLYVWLPDAMAGPTPVSALIHAATMVTAGVYMVARMHLVYMLSPGAMAIVAGIGALTALFAAIIGFAQNDFKKVLAYSTVSQLGFMFAGVGTGNFDGGIFHLYTHAFFKAGLFLCAGSVMHAMSGSGDIRIMGGLSKRTRWTYGVFLVCWLAISGVPFLSGFFSKDSIVGGAFGTPIFKGDLSWVGPAVGSVLLVAAAGTAFYMSRLFFLVFTGETRASEEIKHHIHESPAVMVGPLVILAIGAAVGGAIILPGALFGHDEWNVLAHRLEPVLGQELPIPHPTEWLFMGISSAIAIGGIVVAAAFYYGGYRQPAKKFAAAFPGLVRLVQDKFRIDELYDKIFVRPIKLIGDGIFYLVDRILIDKILVGGPAALTAFLGRIPRWIQNGDGQGYMAWFAIGAAGLLFFVTKPALSGDLHITKSGLDVDVDARHGAKASQQPLEYEFDFDDDGKPDVTGTSSEAHHTYARPGTYKLRITVRNPAWGTKNTEEQRIEVP
jgi:NADH-quinone oxidoreductase subunit L